MKAKKTPKKDLENKKVLFFQIGIIAALAVLIVAFDWNSVPRKANLMANIGKNWIDDDVIPVTYPETPPPAPIPQPIMSDILNIVPDDFNIDEGVDFSSEADKNFKVSAIEYVPKAKVEEEDEIVEDIPAVSLKDKPTFNGGDENTFRNWVNGRIIYPEEAIESNIAGKVILQFTIDTDGSVVNVKVLRKIDPSLDAEAVRVVSSSPKWKPGKLKGKPVRAVYVFPVSFQLQSN